MSDHARLGPSSAKQWIKCTPSVVFGEQFPDRGSSYADEGTDAHTLSEMCISGRATFLGLPGFLTHDEWTAKYAEFTAKSKFWNDEMDAYCKEFADWVIERLKQYESPLLFLEQRLDLTRWVQEGFGTGDVIIVADGVLEIIDLKYGKGVVVESQDNEQLKCYSLGALAAFDILYDIRKVVATIYQPRVDNVVSAEYTTEELLEWAETVLKPAAVKAWAGEGEFVPGSHCKFCRGKSRCAARVEQDAVSAFMGDEELQSDAEPTVDDAVENLTALVEQNLLSDGQFLYWLSKAPRLVKIMKVIMDEGQRRLACGEEVPGWKLVEGRSNRKFASEMEVTTILQTQENPDRFFTPRKVLSPSKVEKELGPKKFKELLGDKVVKPNGKPTMVPESDKRPPMDPHAAAQASFSDEEDED